MPRRLIVIDESKKFCDTVRRLLAAECPDIVFYEHDVSKDGVPTRNFNWLTYDLVMLDYQLAIDSGMNWFKELKEEEANFPALIMLTGSTPAKMVRAKAMGADECANKRKLTRSVLVSTIDFALKFAKSRRKSAELTMRDSTGPQIPGYKVLNKIADGGMSSIYLAEREQDQRHVVVKILYSESVEDDSFVDRFLQEYELICKLNDPNIVKIYAQSYTEQFMYMIMEHFPNGDLHTRIVENQGVKPELALRYLLQIATGLGSIHSCGIVHRDLKPANIMFREDDTLAIIDFGISKELAAQDEITSENLVIGTLSYMSPEGGQGKPIDARSDIYSLGIIFYEMLTGKKPYKAAKPADLVLKHVKSPIPWLPDKFSKLQGLFEIMLAKDPDNRFQSTQQLIDFIENRHPDLLNI